MMPPAAPTGWIVYQPLIVGLGAVVLGLLANTAFEWVKQAIHRRSEARSIRAALIAELKTNLEATRERSGQKQSESAPGWRLMVPLDSHTAVYDAMLPKAGVLTDAEIRAVIDAYNFMMNSPKVLSMLGSIKGDAYFRWADLDAKYGPTLMAMDEAICKRVEAAIRVLEQRAIG